MKRSSLKMIDFLLGLWQRKSSSVYDFCRTEETSENQQT
jgi:hypothetical protein